MSANLEFSELAEGQANKEQTINDIFAEVDAAVTEEFSVVSVSSPTAYTIADDDFQGAVAFAVSGVSGVSRTVVVPQMKKLFLVRSVAANTQTFSVVRGATTVSVAAGVSVLLYTDGTANGLFLAGTGAGATSAPFTLSVAGSDQSTAIASTGLVMTFRMPRAVTLSNVKFSLKSGSGTFRIDVKASGSTIFSTKPATGSGTTTSVGGTSAVLSTTSISDDTEMTIFVDSAGGAAATGLVVTFIGTVT